MNHPTEDELIVCEMDRPFESELGEVARHLEQCPGCAARAEEIARTLQSFSAEPVPTPDSDQAWQRLRSKLPLAYPVRSRWAFPNLIQRWRTFWVPALTTLLVAGALALSSHTPSRPTEPAYSFTEHTQEQKAPSMKVQEPGIATHLDNAERLLTMVSHEPGSLNALTRSQAQQLLVNNAVCVRQARASGDLPELSVLENLGRTLTALNHEGDAGRRWRVHMGSDTNGLLLDIHILQQNSTQSQNTGTA